MLLLLLMFPVLWNNNLFVLTTDCVGWGSFGSWFKSSEGCWPEMVLVGWTLDGLVVDARLWLGLSSSTLGAAPLEGALAWVTSGWICAVGRLLIRRLLRGEDCGWGGKNIFFTVASYSNEGFSCQWGWLFLHPSCLSIWWKERGKQEGSHLNETFSFE